jgi:nitrite reductase (NADH) small subunit
MANFVRVAATGEIPAGQGKTIEVDGKQIALFNVDGTLYAIDNTCKHRGGPLGEGELDGTNVICPWHGWTYNVTNGECLDEPDCHVETYDVRVEGNDVLVGV